MAMVDAKTETLRTFIQHHREQPRSVGFDPDTAETWQAILAKVEQLILPVAAEVNAAMNNPKLSDQGRQATLMAIGPRVTGNFVNVGRVKADGKAAKVRLEKVLFSPITDKPAGNDVVIFLREDAIRRATGKSRADAEFLPAVETGNMEVARALLDWPGGSPISDDIRRRGFEAYAQGTQPEVWARLQAVEVLQDNVTVLAQQVGQWLTHLGASHEAVTKAVGD